jgi:hypothetical protein
MNFFQMLLRFFQFLSKTDQDALNARCCSKSVRMTQTSLGVMVFVTGTLAFFSGSYAIYTAFSGSPWATVLTIPIGILYSFMIMVFDREIVSATNKYAVIVRFPLALAIGLIVAVPLEMRLLQDSIEKEIKRISMTENKEVIATMDNEEASVKKRKRELEEAITHYREEVTKWQNAMEAETVGRQLAGRTGLPGQGPAYEEARRNRDQNQKFLDESKQELSRVEEQEEKVMARINEKYTPRVVAPAYDFLARYQALDTLKENSAAAWWISWGLRMFFILIEVFPALVKLFLPYSEYNAIVEARRRASIQLIHAEGNQRLGEMARTPPVLPQNSFMDALNNQP